MDFQKSLSYAYRNFLSGPTSPVFINHGPIPISTGDTDPKDVWNNPTKKHLKTYLYK